MGIPIIAPDEYPPARRVAFRRIPTLHDDFDDPPPIVTEFARDNFPLNIITTEPYLTALKVQDHRFALQLSNDDALAATYQRVRQSGVSKKDLSNNPGLKSRILTIERALENRMEFAKYQKIHVMEEMVFLNSAEEKERVNEEADAEMMTVCGIVKDWKSESLQDIISDFQAIVGNLMLSY